MSWVGTGATMSDLVTQREDGMWVTSLGWHGEYKNFCMCHRCKKSKNLAPLKICVTLAKLWVISAEHKAVVSVVECRDFELAEGHEVEPKENKR